jgi:hypothetical protein
MLIIASPLEMNSEQLHFVKRLTPSQPTLKGPMRSPLPKALRASDSPTAHPNNQEHAILGGSCEYLVVHNMTSNTDLNKSPMLVQSSCTNQYPHTCTVTVLIRHWKDR